ncbi:lecithin retinol acyltransferase family protein [Variovorax ginsengisoli]|uniref:Lecithin retinol acyltransferase family protein n=1 Tax=Variovorax ginsengisoli TaxID=363844 RepID=A0ABT8SDD9_9BURK|nr:lecithin retinol acyltransferase family protein [Variovorax ginsengisoli]MDN8617766.1 lecithin retinol acyltransferase family protein [Variovorax ginsengisoli]MDO1536936.1 lecithin retinol acyltransferase family protein [Variovorax ginsengisoli]
MKPHTQPVLALDELAVGDHLVSPRRGYSHHGIYAGNGRVIHYSGFSRRWRRGPVEEVSLAHFCLGHPLLVRDSSQTPCDGAARVERARRRLGENRFSVWSNNCEHFCHWCMHGASRSEQIEALRTPLRTLVSLLVHNASSSLSAEGAQASHRAGVQYKPGESFPDGFAAKSGESFGAGAGPSTQASRRIGTLRGGSRRLTSPLLGRLDVSDT